jgi:nucleoside-triphosphatase THEP1
MPSDADLVSTSIVILTGARDAGKSTVCRQTVALARAAGYTCGGLLTLKRAGGALDVFDLQSGESRCLTMDCRTPSTVIQGRFLFNAETIVWSNEALQQAQGCQLLVVDELGPLEIERGEGWQAALDLLREGAFTLALVVVRPELLAQAQRQFRPQTTLHVDEDNRDALPVQITAMLEGCV